MNGAYYNEIEPYCAQWLRNLIAAGHIAPGDVDERSIAVVRADDLRGYAQCHFFAGLGGWSYALRLAGWPDDRPVWTGSCPCQPFSSAGKRKGFGDERHLWPAWAAIIKECRPATILGEQVASAADWLRLVRSDLEAMGYAVGAMPVEAASAGAYHRRDRYWFVGVSDSTGRKEGQQAAETMGHRSSAISASCDGVAHADEPGSQGRPVHAECAGERAVGPGGMEHTAGEGGDWIVCADGKARRLPESGVRLLAHGIPNRVAKLRALGNAIDPRCAAKFIEAVM